MDLYRTIILDHYKHPRNFGTLPHPNRTAEASNATCGDKIRFEVSLDTTTDTVSDLKFSGVGCAISQAAASMLTEKAKGKKLEYVMKLSGSDMIKLIGSVLGWGSS